MKVEFINSFLKFLGAFSILLILFINCTPEKKDFEKIEEYLLAERYGRSMINNFRNGVVAWTDWNILLDETGQMQIPAHALQSLVFAN